MVNKHFMHIVIKLNTERNKERTKMKPSGLLMLILCILIVTACGNSSNSTVSEYSNKPQEELVSFPINLDTEESIKEYLVGEWVFDKNYISDVLCKMNIDEDLNLQLSFSNSKEDFKDNYLGKIILDRLYANENELPDLISIELLDTDNPGGDFFFSSRTISDQEQVMSLFLQVMVTLFLIFT